MITYYDETGLYIQKPENIREIYYVKYAAAAFNIEMKDYQTHADRDRLSYYEKLAAMIKRTL